MNILCISLLWPNQRNRNSSTQLVQQIAARASLGAKITLITPFRYGDARTVWLDEYQPTPAAFYPMAYPAVPFLERFFPRLFFVNAQLLSFWVMHLIRRLGGLGRFDVVHIHGLGSSVVLAKELKKKYNIPVVVTVHGQSPSLQRYRKVREFSEAVHYYLSYFDRIFIVGEPLREFVVDFGVPSEKVEVVHNGHQQPSEDALEVERLRAAYSRRVVIVSVARLYKLKGTDITIQALSRLYRRGFKDWYYLHVGEGPERLDLERMVVDSGLQENIEFLGHLPYQEAMTVLAASDIFVMPSWQEAFGIVYIEAMARGKPVIGCRGSGAEESVRDGVEGILAKGKSVSDVEVALEKLMCNQELRERMGASGQARAEEFTWQRNAEVYLRAYASLLRVKGKG